MNTKVIIAMFMAIVVGSALFIAAWQSASKNVEAQQAYLEAVTLVNNTNNTLAHDNLLTSTFTLYNKTGSTYTEIKSTSNYTLYTTYGYVNLTNATWASMDTYATYQYYDNNYLEDNTSRNLIRLVALFGAVAILGWLIYYNKDNFKELGL
jgi:hypothetical protein